MTTDADDRSADLPLDPIVDATLVAEHLPPADLTAKAANGFAWAMGAFLIMQLESFVTYGIATRKLGPGGIGVVATFLTILTYSDVLLDVGMGATLIYEQEEGQSRRVHVAFTLNTMMALGGSLIVLALSPVLARQFGIPGDVNLFRLLALLVLVKGMNQIPDALLRRAVDFRKKLFADLTRAVGRFAIAVSLLLAGYGPIAMISGIVIAEILATMLTWILARFRPAVAFDKVIAREMLGYGVAVFGSRLTGMLWLNGDYLVVSTHFGSNSKQFGDYYTAFRLPELIIGSVYAMFSSVAFPSFASAREVGPEKLKVASLRALRLLTLFGFAAGVGMTLAARDVIPLLFGKAFDGAILPMEIFGIAAGFAGVGFASGDLYAAVGKPKLGLYFNLVGAPILIAGFILAAPHGVAWIATVHLIVIVPYSFFRIEIANRLVGTTWMQSLRAMRPAFVSAAGILICALPVRLLVGPGFGALVEIVAAGLVGAVLGLGVGDRGTFGELSELVRKALGR